MSDFSDEPVTIGELRAMKTGNPTDITPREVLIAMLREIDSGKVKPEKLIIIYRESTEHGWDTSYFQSGRDLHATIGMMERAKMVLLGIK